jgi:hypothetical protein
MVRPMWASQQTPVALAIAAGGLTTAITGNQTIGSIISSNGPLPQGTKTWKMADANRNHPNGVDLTRTIGFVYEMRSSTRINLKSKAKAN